MVKLASIASSFEGEKITVGMTINISRVEVKEVAGFGKAATIYQGEKAFGTFAKAIVSKAEIILKELPHDEKGRIEEILPVKIVERKSKDGRLYMDMVDAE